MIENLKPDQTYALLEKLRNLIMAIDQAALDQIPDEEVWELVSENDLLPILPDGRKATAGFFSSQSWEHFECEIVHAEDVLIDPSFPYYPEIYRDQRWCLEMKETTPGGKRYYLFALCGVDGKCKQACLTADSLFIRNEKARMPDKIRLALSGLVSNIEYVKAISSNQDDHGLYSIMDTVKSLVDKGYSSHTIQNWLATVIEYARDRKLQPSRRWSIIMNQVKALIENGSNGRETPQLRIRRKYAGYYYNEQSALQHKHTIRITKEPEENRFSHEITFEPLNTKLKTRVQISIFLLLNENNVIMDLLLDVRKVRYILSINDHSCTDVDRYSGLYEEIPYIPNSEDYQRADRYLHAILKGPVTISLE